MRANELFQLLLYFGLLIGLTPLPGGFMERVFEGKWTFPSDVLGPLEKWIYRLGGIDVNEVMSW